MNEPIKTETNAAETETVKTPKKKKWPWVLLLILAVLLTPVIVVFAILYGRLASVASVRHIDHDLYQITVKQDYHLDKLLNANISTYEELDQFITDNMFLGLSASETGEINFGCSSFLAKTPDGNTIAGRNYDFAHTGELVLYTHPSDGYASIGMTELRLMGVSDKTGITPDSFLGKASMLAAPYFTTDGVNEKGLTASLLQLTPGVTDIQTDKPDIVYGMTVRLLLDRADSVEHALELLEQYDVHDPGPYQHHLFIADSSGSAVVVEWKDNKMKVVQDQPTVTNFWLCTTDDKSLYRHRCPRFDKMTEWFDSHATTTPEQAMDLLEAISQEGGGYPTQWSSVYDLNHFAMDIATNRHYDKVYRLTAEDFK